MPITVLGGTKAADTAFSVDNSCRFNSADSAYMHKTLGTATNEKKFTFSAWIKRGLFTGDQTIFNVGPDSSDEWQTGIRIRAPSDYDIHCTFDDRGTSTQLITTAEYRDPAAWMHVVFAVDTTQSTAANRMKLYVNGVQQNDDDTYVNVYPSQNTDCDAMDSGNTIAVGRRTSSTNMYFDGYMAEVCFVDGTQYAASDFGEYDDDSPTIWKPKDVSGLTFGNNGFYLDFEDSANLGNDKNGGTDLTEVNLAAADQCQDSPTNNFCVVNPLDNEYNDASFSQGNTVTYTDGGAVYTFNTGTFFLTAGRWYWEVKVGAGNTTGNYYVIGISDDVSGATSQELGNESTQWSYYGLGHIRTNNGNTASSDYNTYTDGDVIGVYLDLEDNKLYFSKNGTIENSTGISITAPASVAGGGYFPAAGFFDGDASSNSAYFYWNFGNGDYNATAVSSSNADDDGFGLFEYDPTSGTFDGASKKFYAICTKNLATYG
jgi:hypothetical protein